MLLRRFQLRKQRVDIFRLRHEIRLPHNIAKIHVFEPGLLGLDQVVLNIQDTYYIVTVIFVYRNPGIAKLHHLVDVFLRRRIDINAKHIRPRSHHLIGQHVVKGKNTGDHLLALCLKFAAFLSRLQHGHHIILGVFSVDYICPLSADLQK